MANTAFQLKRTSVSGRAANSTTLTRPGELALNMADGIMYSTNGTTIFEIGANNTTSKTSGDMTLTTNNKRLQFTPLAGGANVYFIQQNDDNFVFYSTNTINQPRAVFSIFANSVTSNLNFSVPVNFTGNVGFGTVAISANGTTGTSGQVLTSNGTATFWATATAIAVVNTAAQYAWTNTHSFSANVSVTANAIGLASNSSAIYLNGTADQNWKIGRNTGATTKFYYSNNTLDIIAAASNLEGIAFGQPGGNTYLETGYAGTFTRNPITVGNSTVNTVINSTNFSGTSNNSTYLNGQLASYYTNATNITTGTLPYAQLGPNVINTTASFTISGVHTYNANVIIGTNIAVSANGSYGTAGQILTTNGTSVAWKSPPAVLSVANTNPGTPANNDMWWDSSQGTMFVRYGDGDSAQWVETQSGGIIYNSSGAPPLYIQYTQPTVSSGNKYMWVQTGLGDGTDFTIWIEDGT